MKCELKGYFLLNNYQKTETQLNKQPINSNLLVSATGYYGLNKLIK